jgi:alpha-tubulin suppressor-like RCC1 family protein
MLLEVSCIQGIGNNATVTGDASKTKAVNFGTGVVPTAIAVGNHFACAITNGPGETKGSLYCWGYNEWGQLGIATTKVSTCIVCP